MTRNPDHFCTATTTSGSSCKAYALTGLTVCQKHRGNANVERAAATVTIKDLASAVGVPELKPRDFPKVAAEYIARFNRRFAQLEQEMDERRLLVSETDLAREFGDIFAMQDSTATMVTRLMQAYGALPLPDEVEDSDEAFAEFMSAIDETRDQLELNTGMERCGTCSGEGMVCGSCAATGYVPIHTCPPCERCPAQDAEYAALTTLLLEALAPYPDATAAVRRALSTGVEE